MAFSLYLIYVIWCKIAIFYYSSEKNVVETKKCINAEWFSVNRCKHLRFVIDDSVDCISQFFCCHCGQVHYSRDSFSLQAGQVFWLIAKQGDAHHWNTMVDGLINPIGAAMGDERFDLAMT